MDRPYIGNELVVSPGARHQDAVRELSAAAEKIGIRLQESPHSEQTARVLGDPDYRRVPRSFQLVDDPRDKVNRGPQDAGRLLAAYQKRKEVKKDDALAVMVGLSRAMQADAVQATSPITIGHSPITIGHSPITIGHSPITIGHSPITIGHSPITIGHTPASTYGDRQPVAWIGREPRPSDPPPPGRRPVVLTLDTGIGDHPWFDSDVTTGLELDGVEFGYHDDTTDPERRGLADLAGGLNTHSGHGTFIAGLIRQACPDARLHAVRMMQADGLANEYELLRVLQVLAEKVRRGLAGEEGGLTVDIVVMSFGYAHDIRADERYDDFMLPVLEELGRLGVAVVAAAGNNASTEKVYPAAFAPHPNGRVPQAMPGVVPVTSVGSLNPNGSVALFSNAGPWVKAWMPGAALVSSMPTGLNGGLSPAVSSVDANGMPRATIDPDDFSGGFGVWSGTSFAAPLFAGELAQALVEDGRLGSAEFTPEEMTAVLHRVISAHPAPTDPRRQEPASNAAAPSEAVGG